MNRTPSLLLLVIVVCTSVAATAAEHYDVTFERDVAVTMRDGSHRMEKTSRCSEQSKYLLPR